MQKSLLMLTVAAVLATSSDSSLAGLAFADSDLFAIDTVTAVAEPSSDVPEATRLASVFPNPFNPATSIAFDLATSGEVELAIFDLRGRLVQVIASGPHSAGRHHATWHGIDRNGRAAPSGAYVCRLVADQLTRTSKLLLAR